MAFDKPVLSLPGRQRISDNGRGGRGVIHLTAEETGGAIGMWEAHPAPGTGPGWHTHTRETETFCILAGTFRFWVGEDTCDAGPGGVVALPPHIPHQWKNVGDTPGHGIGISTPGGFERFFIELARKGGMMTPEEIAALNAELGVVDGGMGARLGKGELS